MTVSMGIGRSALLLAAALSLACVLQSPDFDEPTEGEPGPTGSTTSISSASATAGPSTSSTTTQGGGSESGTSTTTPGPETSSTDPTTDPTDADTDAGTDTDADTTTTGDEAWVCDLSPGAWRVGEPVLLSALNSGKSDRDPVLLADGLTLHFSSDRPGGLGGMDGYVAARPTLDDPFGAPTPNGDPTWNTESHEYRGHLRSDGLEAFLSSDYQAGKPTIWFGQRNSVDKPFSGWFYYNALVDSHDPHISADGLRLYFAFRPQGQLVLASMKRADLDAEFGKVNYLHELNTGGAANPTLSDDELLIVFTRRINDKHNLFFAHRGSPGADFNAPVELSELNTGDHDGDPYLAEVGDRCELYFASNRGGDWAIYMAPILAN